MARSKSSLRAFLIIMLVVIAVPALFSAGAYTYVISSTRSEVHTIAQIEEADIKADAILVLGASVFPDGTPSDILADRLEVACDLYLSGAAPSIIVSGDNRTEHYNESDAMKSYCMSLGVPSDAIYVDHAGYDTYSSVYRAHFVYGAQNAIIVTQAYHLYRALAIGNLLGMPSSGVAADKGSYDNQLMYSLREVLARDKDVIQAMLRLPPDEADQPIEN